MFFLLLLFPLHHALADDSWQESNYEANYRIELDLSDTSRKSFDVLKQASGILSLDFKHHCDYYESHATLVLRTVSHTGFFTDIFSENHQRESTDGTFYNFDTVIRQNRRLLVQEQGEASLSNGKTFFRYGNPMNVEKQAPVPLYFPISMQKALWQAAKKSKTILHFPYFEGPNEENYLYYDVTAVLGVIKDGILPVQLSYYPPSLSFDEIHDSPLAVYVIHYEETGPPRKIEIETQALKMHLIPEEVKLFPSSCTRKPTPITP